MPSKAGYWTNPSVRALAHGTNLDPTEVIAQKAHEVVLNAMQKGWIGPPFDPFALADFLKVRVVPREDIPDARTVPGVSGFTVEFNPNRPKARVRYSIFHELAHTLFPDCRDRVRNRVTHSSMQGDDWQLEMLCNLAAADFAMPMGSLPEFSEQLLDIHSVLELRRQYDVSTEAMLLRVVKLTQEQCAVFCAAPPATRTAAPRYVIDYTKPSKIWPSCQLASGIALPSTSLVTECTAIGFTAKGQEDWPTLGMMKVECVGVPPYPNQTYPRVLGLLRPPKHVSSQVPSITYLKGDASEPRGTDSRFILQVVNDAALTWGAGFSLLLRKKWPGLQGAFRSWALTSKNLKLGNIHVVPVDGELTLISMVAQHGYGLSPSPRVRYLALQECLKKASALAAECGASIHMPRIGCGMAGGSWGVVRELIQDEICDRGIKVCVYDIPDAKTRGHHQTALDFAVGT